MEKNIKIITLGETGVGKTSIINRICYDCYNEDEKSTFTCETHYLTEYYSAKQITIQLNFIDTFGQEKFLSYLPKQYIRDSHIVLLVFSNKLNLETLKDRWYKFYKENSNIEKAKFLVIGNKSDIFGANKKEIKSLGKRFAEEINSFFMTCSAKSEDNIDNIVNHILTEAKRLIDEEEQTIQNTSINRKKSFQIKIEKEEKKKKKTNKFCC